MIVDCVSIEQGLHEALTRQEELLAYMEFLQILNFVILFFRSSKRGLVGINVNGSIFQVDKIC